MSKLPRLASLVFGRPHFITPQAGRAIADVILHQGGRLDGPEASRFVGEEQVERDENGHVRTDAWGNAKPKGYRMSGATAIVNVLGELVNRGAWLNASSGLVSYEGVAHVIKQVAADPRVKSILLDVNSPGGEAGGMTEIAALVRRVAAEKPVAAVANTLMCSAAYGLCSGATRIVTTELGVVGSIGVVVMHADYSGALEKRGVDVTLIHAGAHKVDGNPFEPLPEAVRADLEAEVEKYMAKFVDTVAAGRGLDPTLIRSTEARTYLGRESVEVGLADAVGTFEEVLADLESAASGRSVFGTPKSSSHLKSNASLIEAPAPARASAQDEPVPATETGATMSKDQPAASDKTHTQADVDAAATTAASAARTDERKRIGAILGHAAAAGQPALASHLAYETDMSADAAGAMLAKAAPAAPAKTASAPQKPAATAPVVAGLELAEPTAAPAASGASRINPSAIYKARQQAKPASE